MYGIYLYIFVYFISFISVYVFVHLSVAATAADNDFYVFT